MTAFLFTPATQNARLTRRVDLASLASLFAEAEEPTAIRLPARTRAMRLATVAFILIGLVGDTVLVARPQMLADAFATMPSDPGPRGV